MTYHFPADVEERVLARMATGRYASEDEVLRDALDTLDTVEADAREVQVSIDAVNEGDAPVPLNQAFDALRKKYDLLSIRRASRRSMRSREINEALGE